MGFYRQTLETNAIFNLKLQIIMSITDYGMLFEKTVEAYWGNPKTPIYFANYWGHEFETKALLFSIVVNEINYNANDYSPEKLDALKDYTKKISEGDVSHSDNVQILKLLAKHKSV
jgi:hypothetical protein